VALWFVETFSGNGTLSGVAYITPFQEAQFNKKPNSIRQTSEDTLMPGSPLDEAIKWKLALIKNQIDYAQKRALEISVEMQRGNFEHASDLSALARILNECVPEQQVLESPPVPGLRLQKWLIVLANLQKQIEWEEDFFRTPGIGLEGREASSKRKRELEKMLAGVLAQVPNPLES
jgi:hypothetical protein